jgi:hypothetical protein
MAYYIVFSDGSSGTYDDQTYWDIAMNDPGAIVSANWVPDTQPEPEPEPEPETGGAGASVTYFILDVTISPASSGMVVPSPYGDYLSPGRLRYPAGTIVTLQASSSISLGSFNHWEGYLTGTVATRTIVMDRDIAVTAVFNVPANTVSLSAYASGGVGYIAPDSGVFQLNSTIILVATPGEGYEFVGWSGDIDGTTEISDYQLQVTMNKNRNIVGIFRQAEDEGTGEVPESAFRSLEAALS